jgi:hypothetical protein
MEHYKSTLATAAIAALGLVAAAHVLHPGNYERTTYPSRPVATVASQASAWVNPPANLPVAETALLDTTPASEVAAPAKVAAIPVAWTSASAPLQAAEVAPAREPRRKAANARRHKMAQRQARLRQAALARPAAQPVEAAPATAKPQANRIDPIGDLIRGLGLGSDS